MSSKVEITQAQLSKLRQSAKQVDAVFDIIDAKKRRKSTKKTATKKAAPKKTKKRKSAKK